ncbi:flagellar brake protein [Brevibacillus sp. B_LB10_24]|uniref:flagellar brake protein n=1 Tax=Brevibacillus sp. B_LB10_24 TaxID=3380645 RepID=UPI0038BCD1CE
MKLPQIGQIIWLSPDTSADEETKTVLKSRIADFTRNAAAIELPIDERTKHMERVKTGSLWKVWYMGDDGLRHDFHTEVMGFREENIPLLLIKLPDPQDIVRTQRRSYVRVPAEVEISVKSQEQDPACHFLAKTLNVSGGGLAFSCEEKYPLKEKQLVNIWLNLPNRKGTVSHAYSTCEITRIEKKTDFCQWVSVKFLDISEGDRQKVIRTCYERQLELNKRGIPDS